MPTNPITWPACSSSWRCWCIWRCGHSAGIATLRPIGGRKRDFLRRYLGPLLQAVADGLRGWPVEALDATIRQLIGELPDWADHQAAELEARVGRYRDPDAGNAAGAGPAEGRTAAATRVVDQNLWG